MEDDRLELLGQVASWYYEDNLDQSVIAERIGKSRSMASRILQEAREVGLVEIKVTFPLKRDTELESFSLKHLTSGKPMFWLILLIIKTSSGSV
ncbi:MAG: hypothetical protein HS114_14510 [Anaerolineales bacterium]|nr:hypothetical protein [Anaerolineales bacterium]